MEQREYSNLIYEIDYNLLHTNDPKEETSKVLKITLPVVPSASHNQIKVF